MKTNSFFSALIIGAISVAVFSSVKAAEPDEPAVVIKKLYAARTDDSPIFNQTDDRAILDRFFRKDLADMIWKDAKDANGEMGALDFDPLYYSQDPQITDFDPGETGWGGDKKGGGENDAVVQTTFKDNGEERMISYQFERNSETKVWKIFDVRYPDGRLLAEIFRGEPEADAADRRSSYQVIPGTTSPDEIHALAWGLRGVANLAGFMEGGKQEVDEEKVENYIVNVESGDILLNIPEGTFWVNSDGENVRGRALSASWASNELVLIDYEGKRGNIFLSAFSIKDGIIAASGDMHEAVTAAAVKHVAAKHAAEYKRSKKFLIFHFDGMVAEGENSWEITAIADVTKNADKDAGVEASVKVRFFVEDEDANLKFTLLTAEAAPDAGEAEESVDYKPGGAKWAEVWEAFYDNPGSEADLMTPLVMAGPKMVPVILEAISHKDMRLRRYAIGALGNINDARSLEPLAAIARDKSELDYFRGDALQAIYMLDQGRGTEMAGEFADEDDVQNLKDICEAISKKEPWLLAGLEAEALAGEPSDGQAYVIDKDPDGLNIRAEPRIGAVIGNLPNIARPDALFVHIVGEDPETGWVQIDLGETSLGETPWAGLGWVAGNMLAVHTKGKGGKDVPLYETADGKGKVVATIPANVEVTIAGSSGKALKVKYKAFTGWLMPESQCANPEGGCK